MTVRFPSLATVVLTCVALIAWTLTAKYLREDGGLRAKIHDTEQRVKARESVIAVLAARVPKVDTVLARDTRHFTDWAGRYQRLRDSLHLVPDSSTTVSDLSTVVRVINAADSTVAACSRALKTCGAAIALRDTLLAHKDTLLWATDSVLRWERKRRKGFRFLGIPLGCTAGGVVSAKGLQPGVGCGVRF